MSYNQPPPPPSYGSVPPQGGGGQAPDHPQGTTILILGILSIVCCGLFTGIPAIIMGNKARKEIASTNGQVGNAGLVQGGFICGIIGTVLSLLAILFYVFLFAVAAGSGTYYG